jgi:hypothetical protein
MSTPIPERLANVLALRLQEITVANGYPFDVTEVVRPNREGNTMRYTHQSIRIDQMALDRVEDLDCPGNPPALCWSQSFDVRCYARNSNRPDDMQDPEVGMPHTTNTNEMLAAALKAITDADQWHTMDNLGFDTRFGDVVAFSADDGEYNGHMVTIACFYRAAENDPYNVRA